MAMALITQRVFLHVREIGEIKKKHKTHSRIKTNYIEIILFSIQFRDVYLFIYFAITIGIYRVCNNTGKIFELLLKKKSEHKKYI